jgi:hypothetical protein
MVMAAVPNRRRGDEVLLSAIRHAIERSRTALGQEAKIREIRDGYA